eukprot:CAMPEP_0117437522 /NCGR_PEP_ID=MMETSP0759-20121206/1565_1 /TAXON_ID=63605 /ORGANISM="Percolomonas cosmopolitus, Strain WS" /LENGTH=84 /DNA_ID=CAMNT_0005229153 /DNA_START=474 /DNA_END=724 /DNA_ORIENTATION=+
MAPIDSLRKGNHSIAASIVVKNSKVSQRKKDDLKCRDRVRLVEWEDKFSKSGIKWTKEIFRIKRVIRPKPFPHPTKRIRYKVEA